jgi:hypothetical protein
VTNRNVKEEITERITNSGQFYHLVRNILWKWEMPKKGEFTTCHVNVCSRNLDMGQGRYQQTNNSRDGILRSVEGKNTWERIRNKKFRI